MSFEESINLLVRLPKKKYLKRLFETCVILNGSEARVDSNFRTPIIETLQTEIQDPLSKLETHQVVLGCISLIKESIRLQFDEQSIKSYLQNLKVEEGLKEVILEMVLGFEDQIREKEKLKVSGAAQLDLDSLEWDLSLEAINNKGKANSPIVAISLPLIDYEKADCRKVELEMKGEQFEVFFSQLSKVKETLNDLISEEEAQ